MDKLYPILCDLTVKNLNLSENDLSLLTKNVEVVFHSAASVRFDETLREAVILNTRGTQEMLFLSEKMIKLKSFVYVSTAFSNTNHKLIKETVYTPFMDYQTVISACDEKSDENLLKIEKEMLKVFPNTYIFSKNLAEKLVDDFKYKIPVAIIRPSIGKIVKNYLICC